MTKAYDELPFILRLILQIFFGYPIGVVYRIVKYVENRKNIVTLIVGIIGIFGFGFIFWLVDLITTIIGNGICVLAE